MTERLEVMESKLELSSGSFSKINNGVTSLRQSIINLQENTKNTTVSLSEKNDENTRKFTDSNRGFSRYFDKIK